MGCLIGCVSGLPIRMNDECVGFICVCENTKDKVNFAPNYHIKPIFPAFYGLYNNYCHLENVNVKDEYMKHLLKNLNMNIEDIQEAITHPHLIKEKPNKIEEILKIKDDEKLILCLEHKKVFEYLVGLSINSLQKNWNKDIETGRIVLSIQRFKEEINKCHEQCPELYNSLINIFDGYNPKFRLLNEYAYTGWMKYYTIFTEDFTMDYENEVRRKAYLETSAFWLSLGMLNIPFHETFYCGQNDSLDIRINLNQIYSDILYKQYKEIDSKE